jgi:hypothetical protein
MFWLFLAVGLLGMFFLESVKYILNTIVEIIKLFKK